MCYAPRNVGPGGGALRGDELGDVIKCDDVMALIGFAGQLTRNTHVEIAIATSPVDGDLPLDQSLAAGARRREEINQFRHHVAERVTQHLRLGVADQLLGRAVEDADPPLRIHANDAGAGARQHRFGEPAAAVDEVAGAHDVVALRP